MTSATPLTVLTSFQVLPDSRETWVSTWRQVAHAARGAPGCQQFRLFHDRHNDDHFVVFSEWDSEPEFHDFVRDAGLTWVDRGLGYSFSPPSHACLEAIPLEPKEAIFAQSTGPVAVGST